MTATQGRLADTIDVFYSAADKASEGAMAAHAYKRAVDDLDTGIGRELVRPSLVTSLRICIRKDLGTGSPVSHDRYGTFGQNERYLPCRERAHQQARTQGLQSCPPVQPEARCLNVS